MNDSVTINHSSDKYNRQPLENILPINSQSLVLEKLEHFSIYSDRLIVLRGEDGSGKSTIVKRLARLLQKPIEVYQASCREPDWLAHILSQHGIKSTAAQRSFQFGMAQLNPTKDTVILLDDAELLDIEHVELLVEKVSDENFHCVLAMNNNARALKWLVEYPESVIFHDTMPLDNGESKALLTLMLQEVVAYPEQSISQSDIEQIIALSQGNPAKIKQAAQRVLQTIDSAKSTNESEKLTKSKLLIGVASLVLAIFLTTVLIFQDDVNRMVFGVTDDPKSVTKSADDTTPLEKSNELFINDTSIEKKNSVEKQSDNSALKLSEPTDIIQIVEKELSEAEGELLIGDSTVQEAEIRGSKTNELKIGVTEIVPPTDSATQPSVAEPTVVAVEPSVTKPSTIELSTIESSTAVFSKTVPSTSEITKSQELPTKKSPIASLSNDGKSDNTLDFLSNDSTSDLNDKPKAIVQAPVVKEELTPVVSINKNVDTSVGARDTTLLKSSADALETLPTIYSETELALLDLDDNRWVLQLGSFEFAENVAKFVKDNREMQPLLVYRKERSGKLWFVVVSDSFVSKSEASSVRDSWLAKSSSVKPWLRSVKSIKREIFQSQSQK